MRAPVFLLQNDEICILELSGFPNPLDFKEFLNSRKSREFGTPEIMKSYKFEETISKSIENTYKA